MPNVSTNGGGTTGEVSGYNCEQINGLRDIINTTAQEAGEGIVDRLHSDIVTPMSSVWYTPEAVSFFEAFAATVKASGENIRKAFDTFRVAVEDSGKNWADNTGGEAPSLPELDSVELDLDVSEILPKTDNGDVVIDEGEATKIANSLPEVEASIKDDLEQLAQDLNADTAFIGHGQANAIQTCFTTVSGEVYRIFKYLTDGDDSLQSQINKAVEKHADVSTSIADAYNNFTIE